MSSARVLDASSAVRIVFQAPEANPSFEALTKTGRTHVPAIYMTETANALARHVRAGDVAEHDAQALLASCRQLVDEVGDDAALAPRALTSALRHRLSAYDAAYLELARQLSCPLVTLDRRLGEAARSVGVEVLGH